MNIFPEFVCFVCLLGIFFHVLVGWNKAVGKYGQVSAKRPHFSNVLLLGTSANPSKTPKIGYFTKIQLGYQRIREIRECSVR